MSLKTDLAKRIIEGMIAKARRENGDDYVVLVVDSHTARIISSCCRVYDIMDAGVLVLESLKLQREKLDMTAIYFIEPTEDSIRLFIQDFSDKKKPQYTNVHLFFTSHVPDDIMTDLGQSNAAVDDRIKTLLELNCDFLAFESRIFLFDRRGALADLFFPENNGDPRRKELDAEAKQLVSLCLTIGEYPHIRFTSNVRLCQDLAKKVESGLNTLIANLPDWEANKDRERGTLLIVDRSLDPIAPLMHEYTYQAMVNDLLKVRGEVAFIPKKDKSVDKEDNKSAVPKGHTGPKMTEAELKDPNAKDGWEEVLLGEDDPLWMEFRHAHIANVISTVSRKFNEFKGKNAMANLSSKGQEASVRDMIQAMKAMPQYKTLIRQYYKHLSLADECLKYFNTEFLESVSELEQDMATGLDSDNNPVKPKDIKTKITTTCTSSNITVINKLRLIMIYIISQGAVGHSRKDLWSAAKITLQLEKAILNLKHLGIDLQRKPQASNRDPKRSQLAMNASSRISLALMRFVPILWDVMSNLVNDTLSKDLYPYLKEPPPKELAKRDAGVGVTSTRVKRGWRQGNDKTESKETESAKRPGARFIVFMMGGVTFSEIRSAYEIHDDTKAQLYLGSTETLTAQDFIRVLGNFAADQDLKSGAEAGTLETRGGAGAGSAAGGRKPRDPDDLSDDDDLDDDPPPRSNLAVRNKGRV